MNDEREICEPKVSTAVDYKERHLQRQRQGSISRECMKQHKKIETHTSVLHCPFFFRHLMQMLSIIHFQDENWGKCEKEITKRSTWLTLILDIEPKHPQTSLVWSHRSLMFSICMRGSYTRTCLAWGRQISQILVNLGFESCRKTPPITCINSLVFTTGQTGST